MTERNSVLLIRCSHEERNTIRKKAKEERRTISGYIMNVVAVTLRFEEKLMARLHGFERLNTALSRRPIRVPGPRTALLLQCSVSEAHQIRKAAKRRNATISGFVLHSLRLSWNVAKSRSTTPAAAMNQERDQED